MRKDIYIYISWCCRFGPCTRKCSYRCLADRRYLTRSNVLISEEVLNTCNLLYHAHTMSMIRWYKNNVRWSLESFSVFWLLARGLFKISFYDGMFCVGIAATGMNRFKGHGSLNNFASVTQGFLLQHPFQTSLSNLVLGTVVHKPSNPSRWALKCSDADSWYAAHEITETIEMLRSNCCFRAFKMKSLYYRRDTWLSLKTLFEAVSARCSFSSLLGLSTSSSDSNLIPHAQSVCPSAGLILNYKTKCLFFEADNLLDTVGPMLGDPEIK